LEALARKNLAADQRERMAQIRELLNQSKQAREQDLVTAVNLARHADTLVKDLLAHLP
jgi:predicted transcriptional regulator